MTRTVSPQTRALCVGVAGFAAWQFAWVSDQAHRLAGVLPEPWTVTGWLATWVAVMVVASVAAISGRDLPTRFTLGMLAVVEVAGCGVAMASTRPIGEEFWAVGQAMLIIAVCMTLLASPLRATPKGLDRERGE